MNAFNRRPDKIPRNPFLYAAIQGNALSSSGGLASLLTKSVRQRDSWNDRFAQWERPESDSETKRIERARDMVQDTLSANRWLTEQGTRLVQQGSFTNRTNTRGESDIDLRVQHPSINIEYARNVDQVAAYRTGNYCDTGRSFANGAAEMRAEIISDLGSTFGRSNIDVTGKKAIRVFGVEGSRAEVDVVPCFTLHHIRGTSFLSNEMVQGIAILGTNGSWTFNYPDQHIANGRTKRENTGHQFKKVVRIVKRMQTDMIEHKVLERRVPSFLIECLVYLVEDNFFTADDDRYGRVKRILTRISERLSGGFGTLFLTEINGIKPLFGPGQNWTLPQAQEFVRKALDHLGDA